METEQPNFAADQKVRKNLNGIPLDNTCHWESMQDIQPWSK